MINGEPVFRANIAGPAGIFAVWPKKFTSIPFLDISRSATRATSFPAFNLSTKIGMVFSLWLIASIPMLWRYARNLLKIASGFNFSTTAVTGIPVEQK